MTTYTQDPYSIDIAGMSIDIHDSAVRALVAWDESIARLPTAGLLSERMEELRVALFPGCKHERTERTSSGANWCRWRCKFCGRAGETWWD